MPARDVSELDVRSLTSPLRIRARYEESAVSDVPADRFSRLGHGLVQQPSSPMSAITHSAWNATQPGFKSDTQRIRKKNRGIKRRSSPEQRNSRKQRTIWQRNNRIYFRNELPHRRYVSWHGDCDLSVRTPILDRADCGHAHHCVTQPVA